MNFRLDRLLNFLFLIALVAFISGCEKAELELETGVDFDSELRFTSEMLRGSLESGELVNFIAPISMREMQVSRGDRSEISVIVHPVDWDGVAGAVVVNSAEKKFLVDLLEKKISSDKSIWISCSGKFFKNSDVSDVAAYNPKVVAVILVSIKELKGYEIADSYDFPFVPAKG